MGIEGVPYLHEPYSTLTGLEHDMFVRIWLRVLVILATERVERLLLVFNGKVIHSETERSLYHDVDVQVQGLTQVHSGCHHCYVDCLVITAIKSEYLCKYYVRSGGSWSN